MWAYAPKTSSKSTKCVSSKEKKLKPFYFFIDSDEKYPNVIYNLSDLPKLFQFIEECDRRRKNTLKDLEDANKKLLAEYSEQFYFILLSCCILVIHNPTHFTYPVLLYIYFHKSAKTENLTILIKYCFFPSFSQQIRLYNKINTHLG